MPKRVAGDAKVFACPTTPYCVRYLAKLILAGRLTTGARASLAPLRWIPLSVAVFAAMTTALLYSAT